MQTTKAQTKKLTRDEWVKGVAALIMIVSMMLGWNSVMWASGAVLAFFVVDDHARKIVREEVRTALRDAGQAKVTVP